MDHVGCATQKPQDFKESLRKREGVTCECVRNTKSHPNARPRESRSLWPSSLCRSADAQKEQPGIPGERKSMVSQQRLQTWNDMEMVQDCVEIQQAALCRQQRLFLIPCWLPARAYSVAKFMAVVPLTVPQSPAMKSMGLGLRQ